LNDIKKLEGIDSVRLDYFVATNVDILSRSMASKLILDGLVTVNGISQKPSYKLKNGQQVMVYLQESDEINLRPQNLHLNIIFEDDDMVVINKKAGLPVHPGPGHPDHTLVNGVLFACPDISSFRSIRPGIVHRLDKDTSGVIIVAKNDNSLSHISEQIKNRTVVKKYIGLVKGNLESESAIIDAPIGRDPYNRKRMAVVENGKNSITKYDVVTRYKDYDYLDISPLTGRTHQIRVHLSSIGYPIAGDSLYNGTVDNLQRQFLHAKSIEFQHPTSKQHMKFTADLADDLKLFLTDI
jgi:23S rRNA pseudouridine1911/1915/1917 synthase